MLGNLPPSSAWLLFGTHFQTLPCALASTIPTTPWLRLLFTEKSFLSEELAVDARPLISAQNIIKG